MKRIDEEGRVPVGFDLRGQEEWPNAGLKATDQTFKQIDGVDPFFNGSDQQVDGRPDEGRQAAKQDRQRIQYQRHQDFRRQPG